MKNKKIQDVSNEELKKLVRQLSPPEQMPSDIQSSVIEDSVLDKGFTTPIASFIQKYDIAPGQTKVHKKLLYSLYVNTFKKDVTMPTFIKHMSMFIPYDSPYFSINKAPLAVLGITEDIQSSKRRNAIANKNTLGRLRRFVSSNKQEEFHWIEDFVLYRMYDIWLYRQGYDNNLKERDFRTYIKTQFEHKEYDNNNRNFSKLYCNIDVVGCLTKEGLKNVREKFYGKKEKSNKDNQSSGGSS